MIATVTNQEKTRWMIIDEAFNSDKLIEFLEALTKDTGKKVLLILDNLRVHHSQPVKAWVAERTDKIEVFYLPSYSPELNPEERLNADLESRPWAKGCRCAPKPNCAMRPTIIWPCWSAHPSVCAATFRTSGSSMPLKTSSGRINKGRGFLRRSGVSPHRFGGFLLHRGWFRPDLSTQARCRFRCRHLNAAAVFCRCGRAQTRHYEKLPKGLTRYRGLLLMG